MSRLGIDTKQNIQIDYTIAPLGARIVAYIIDFLIIAGFSFIFGVIGDSLGDTYYSSETITIIFNYLFAFPLFFYHLISELTMNGQSVGKRVKQIKVMKLDGTSATFSSYFLRFLLRVPLDYLFGLAVIFFNGKGQRLGDLAAGTTIINIQKQVNLSDITLYEMEENYVMNFPEVMNLKDSEINLIRRILAKRKYERKHESVIMLSNKIQEILSIRREGTSSYDEYRFLQDLVKDFNHHYNQQ
ncbi:MAG: RDD family protein [Flavobacteriales bacterium]|nr:RDD family protein [Flavobacteriales bacterium]